MAIGPIIPGRPTPAKPAAKTPTKSVNTTTLSGVLAASKPKPTPVARYIPANANPAGKTFQQVTAANNAAIKAGSVPKPTQTTPSKGLGGSSKTGSIEQGLVNQTIGAKTDTGGGTGKDAKAEKPLEVVLPQEEMDAVQAAADALRLFQENQAKSRLQTVLGQIDRAAIEQYKGIANDYAARGMARSGGKVMAEDKAVKERDLAVNEATQAVTDFLNELKLTGNLEQASTNLSKSQAFQDYINGRLAPATGG